jgi:DNA-directed RNA polymerase specialized sigma24 family protein
MSNEPDVTVRAECEALFRDPSEGLFHHARLALGRNSSAARDLVQVVFQAAWQQRDEVFQRDLDGQRAWLYVVLHRKIVDHIRRNVRRTARESAEIQELRDRHRQARSGLQVSPSWS